MSAESGWAAGVGAAAGVLSWVVGLGKVVWPRHPGLAVFLITVGVTVVAMVILERNDRRSAKLAHP
jgi:hypothetical protein